MLEKLLQAAVITLLLSFLASAKPPKNSEVPSFSTFQAFSLPLLRPQLHTAFTSGEGSLTH